MNINGYEGGTMEVTDKLSPLGEQLASMIQRGIVTPNPYPMNDFPSAMVVVPVYDSTGTGALKSMDGEPVHAELARHSW